jgi:hypothetical protein
MTFLNVLTEVMWLTFLEKWVVSYASHLLSYSWSVFAGCVRSVSHFYLHCGIVILMASHFFQFIFSHVLFVLVWLHPKCILGGLWFRTWHKIDKRKESLLRAEIFVSCDRTVLWWFCFFHCGCEWVLCCGCVCVSACPLWIILSHPLAQRRVAVMVTVVG